MYRGLHPDAPWLTPQAIEMLEGWLTRERVGIEWGSGRSTAWLASRMGSLTSVEHDPVYYGRVLAQLRARGIANVELLLRMEATPYASVVARHAPRLDFALVDGAYRDACVASAIRQLRPGGILMLDNAERYVPSDGPEPEAVREPPSEAWRVILEALGSWPVTWSTNGVWVTAWWEKPGASTSQARVHSLRSPQQRRREGAGEWACAPIRKTG